MFRKPLLRATIIGLGLTIVAAGCASDQLTAPPPTTQTAQASGSLLGGLLGGVVGLVGGVVTLVGNLLVPAVQRSSTLSSDVVVSQTIDSRGGSISIPKAGMRITFSPGAVSAPTTVTVTANAGQYIAYSFEPHGIQFAAPVVISQDMSNINTSNYGSLMGGYMANGITDLDPSTGTVNVTEQYPVVSSYGWLNGRFVPITSFTIKHFSGYILTGGRQ